MGPEPLKILLIEDNPHDVALLGDILAEVPSVQLEWKHCARLREAQEYLGDGNPKVDVILLDLGLPDSQGFETFRRVHQQAPAIPIVVLTVLDDTTLAMQAVREGAQDYLVKGQIYGDQLVRTMRYSIERLGIQTALRRARDECETLVQERTLELATANEGLRQGIVQLTHVKEELRRTLLGTIQAMALTSEVRDPYTAGHQRKVSELACAVAQIMGLPEHQIEGIRLAGLIHDLGKINVPAEILVRPGRLTETEMGLIKVHPQVGYDILKAIDFPWPVAPIVLQHHERLDGSGYPQGLAGQDILLEARILGVADVVEAMTSHRPYRPALGIDKALAEISHNRGLLYDDAVVEACLQHFRPA